MNSNTVEININCPVEKVFDFTTNPENTPKWIKSVVKEWIVEDEISVGTIFKQIVRDEEGQYETQYIVTAYEKNKLFQLQQVGSDYECAYSYLSTNNGKGTRLIYHEHVGLGNTLEDPLGLEPFEILNKQLEDPNS